MNFQEELQKAHYLSNFVSIYVPNICPALSCLVCKSIKFLKRVDDFVGLDRINTSNMCSCDKHL